MRFKSVVLCWWIVACGGVSSPGAEVCLDDVVGDDDLLDIVERGLPAGCEGPEEGPAAVISTEEEFLSTLRCDEGAVSDVDWTTERLVAMTATGIEVLVLVDDLVRVGETYAKSCDGDVLAVEPSVHLCVVPVAVERVEVVTCEVGCP